MELLSQQKLSISLAELNSTIVSHGYEVSKVKYDKKSDWYVATAKKDDQELSAHGKTVKQALANLLNAVAYKYSSGIEKIARWKTTFESQLQEIAEAYSKAPSYDKKGAAAFMELAHECTARADVIRQHLQVVVTHNPEPYQSPEKMYDDIRKHRKLEVSAVGSDQHPIWSSKQVIDYRICLDVLGYTAANSDWQWDGSNQAYAAFAALLPELAQEALFSELLGQTAYATYYRAYGPAKVCLLNKILDPIREKENPHKGFRGIHPSQMLIPSETPEAKQKTSAKIKPNNDGTIPFDINDGWSSTLENIPVVNYPVDYPDFLNIRGAGDVLDGLHTDWADLPLTNIKQSVADPQWLQQWIDQNGPYLFHEHNVHPNILSQNGILPSNLTGENNYQDETKSRDNHIYLRPINNIDIMHNSPQALWHGQYITGVDIRGLDPALFNSDEDAFLGPQRQNYNLGEDQDYHTPDHWEWNTAGEWGNDAKIDQPHQVAHSLNSGGIAYNGSISPKNLIDANQAWEDLSQNYPQAIQQQSIIPFTHWSYLWKKSHHSLQLTSLEDYLKYTPQDLKSLEKNLSQIIAHQNLQKKNLYTSGSVDSSNGANGLKMDPPLWSNGKNKLLSPTITITSDQLPYQNLNQRFGADQEDIKIRQEWRLYRQDDPEGAIQIEHAVANAIKAALFLEDNTLAHGAIQYQSLLHHISKDPEELWKYLHSARSEWNSERFGNHTAEEHRPWVSLNPKTGQTPLFTLAQMIDDKHPELPAGEAVKEAQRLIHKMLTRFHEQSKDEEKADKTPKDEAGWQTESKAIEKLMKWIDSGTGKNGKFDHWLEHTGAKVNPIQPHKYGPEYDSSDNHKIFNLQRYPAVHGKHVQSISKLLSHLDRITEEALVDVHSHDGKGHHFRAFIMSLEELDPKTVGVMWLLLAPYTSQLSMIDDEMRGALGHHKDDNNARDYMLHERELMAHRDGMGLNHIPLGHFNLALQHANVSGDDTKQSSVTPAMQDLSALRVENPTPAWKVKFSPEQGIRYNFSLTPDVCKPIQEQWNNSVATRFAPDEIPTKKVRPAFTQIAKTASKMQEYRNLGMDLADVWNKIEEPEQRTAAIKTADKLHDFLMNPKSRPDLQTPEGQDFLNRMKRYYHNEKTDQLMPWLTREWKKGRFNLGTGIFHTQLPGDYTGYGTFKNPSDPLGLGETPLTRTALNHWGDFMNSQHPLKREMGDIMQHPVHEFANRIHQWDQDLANQKTQETANHGQVVHTTPDNWTIRRLTEPEELEAEGDNMGHCVGSGGYHGNVANGATHIYSLRDPQGQPHATMEIEPTLEKDPTGQQIYAQHPYNGQVIQIQGKGNEEPIPEYQNRIRNWFESMPYEQRPTTAHRGWWDDEALDHPDQIQNYHLIPNGVNEYGLPIKPDPDYHSMIRGTMYPNSIYTRGDPCFDYEKGQKVYDMARAQGQIPELAYALNQFNDKTMNDWDRNTLPFDYDTGIDPNDEAFLDENGNFDEDAFIDAADAARMQMENEWRQEQPEYEAIDHFYTNLRPHWNPQNNLYENGTFS